MPSYILVGRSDHTHNLEFYHPPATKNIITSSTYQLDESMTAGPVFNLPFDGGLFINKYCEHNEKLCPPKFTPETTVYLQNINNSYIKAEIINIPTAQEGIYTIQYDDGSIHQVHEKQLQLNDPNQDPSTNDILLNTFPSWAVNKAKCTLFLNEMNQPSQGTLTINGNSWEFRPGHKHHNIPISLPNLDRNIRHLIQSCQLFKGFAKSINSVNWSNSPKSSQTTSLPKHLSQRMPQTFSSTAHWHTMIRTYGTKHMRKSIWDYEISQHR